MATGVTPLAAVATSNDNIIESLSNKDIQTSSSSSSSPLPPYWIELTEKKQFSRLLYTNPVCFLCCNSNSDSTSYSSNDLVTIGGNDEITSGTDVTPCDSTESQKEQGYGISSSSTSHNVMVLSWLTATNNNGQFVFSIHRRRHSASLLLNTPNETTEAQASLSHTPNPIGNLFTLSVPIQGMEELVLAVGRVSGRHVDKFSSSLSSRPNTSMYNDDKNNDQQHQQQQQSSSSLAKIRKNNYKKSRRNETEDGPAIPGLKAIPIPLDPSWMPSSSSSSTSTTAPLCYIDGTVAYMVCQVVQVLDNNYNDDHYTVLGQIRSAKVLSTYWDIPKNLFRPMNNCGNIDTMTTSSDANVSATETDNTKIRPYLTFFGSQTFGYVVT